MASLVESIEEIVENVITLSSYRSGTADEQRFFHKRIKNGRNFVALQKGNVFLFAPSKFAGYKSNDLTHNRDLRNRNGGATDQRIATLLDEVPPSSQARAQVEAAFLRFCDQLALEPSKHPRMRRYWLARRGSKPKLKTGGRHGRGSYDEGSLERVFANRFERNPEARRACIEHYGLLCQACGFDFEATYGPLGMGFIHVHHMRPLRDIRVRHKVDPIKDLLPLCPNCHSMIHREERPISVPALRKLVSATIGKRRGRDAP